MVLVHGPEVHFSITIQVRPCLREERFRACNLNMKLIREGVIQLEDTGIYLVVDWKVDAVLFKIGALQPVNLFEEETGFFLLYLCVGVRREIIDRSHREDQTDDEDHQEVSSILPLRFKISWPVRHQDRSGES